MTITPNGAVASEIRAEMARQQRRQAELAGVLGISQSGVSARLSGRIPLTVTDLILIAQWLAVPASRLLAPSLPDKATA